MTQTQVNKKYKGMYIEFSSEYCYQTRQYTYKVLKKYKTIKENTTLGEDVGTEMEYRR